MISMTKIMKRAIEKKTKHNGIYTSNLRRNEHSASTFIQKSKTGSMIRLFVCLFVYHFSQYSTIFQLYDGGQYLLVEERTQLHYTMYLGRDHRPSASKLTNFLTHSHRFKHDLY
jgi:hypothetical protein